MAPRTQVVRLKGAAATDKPALLLALRARALAGGRAIAFAAQKRTAHRLNILLGLAGFPAVAELHGDMTQACHNFMSSACEILWMF